jgi:hypothetical protein
MSATPKQPTATDGTALIRCTDLLAIHIPTKLAEDFDNFVVMGISALEACSERKDWTPTERAIVEWLEHDHHKANTEVSEPARKPRT